MDSDTLARLADFARRGRCCPPRETLALLADRAALEAERDAAQRERDKQIRTAEFHKAAAVRAEAENQKLRAAMRENVGDAYNLITQGELPTQRRQPSARRIYDRSLAALAAGSDAAEDKTSAFF